MKRPISIDSNRLVSSMRKSSIRSWPFMAVLSVAVFWLPGEVETLHAQAAFQPGAAQPREQQVVSNQERERSRQPSERNVRQESDQPTQRRNTDRRDSDRAVPRRDRATANQEKDSAPSEQNQNRSNQNRSKQNRDGGQDTDWTPAMKRRLVTFLREHRPQLLKMMNWLEKNRPEEFQKAIVPLMKTQDRLEALQEKNPDAYENALNDWKLDTDIQVAAARAAVNDTPQNRKTLRELLVRKQAVKVDRLRAARDRLKERIANLNAQIRAVLQDQEAIDRAMNNAIKRASRLRAATKPDAGASAGDSTESKEPKKSDRTEKDNGKSGSSDRGKERLSP